MNTGKYEDFKPLPNDCTVVYAAGNFVLRQVVCAANKYENITILGVRHFCKTMNRTLDALGMKGSEPHEQGFVDQWG